jgi:hypothetical protein
LAGFPTRVLRSCDASPVKPNAGPVGSAGTGQSDWRLVLVLVQRLPHYESDIATGLNLLRSAGHELRESRDLDQLNPLTQDFSID